MKKFKEMFEDYNTKKMAKKHGRTFEQQKYRKELAKSLKLMRTHGEEGRKLASETLEHERMTNKYLVSCLSKSRKGGNDLAKKMDIGDLVRNIENFEGLDQSIAEELVKQGYWKKVMDNVDKFSGLNYEKIFMDINKRKYDDIDRENFYLKIVDKFDGFIDITKIIREFHNRGYDDILIKTIGNFEKHQDYKEILKTLISVIGWDYYSKTPRLYAFLSRVSADADILKYLYRRLDEEWRGKLVMYIAGHISKFHGLLDLDIAKILLLSNHKIVAWDKNGFDYLQKVKTSREVIEGIKWFEGSDHKGIAEMIIKVGDNVELLMKNLSNFKGVSYDNEFATLLVKYGQIKCLAKYLDKFEGLDKGIAQNLIQAGYGNVVLKYPEKFGLKKEK